MTEADLPAVIEAARAATDPPSEGDDVTFAAPWQARAFGLTVALRRQGNVDWDRFQELLVEELDDVEGHGEEAYYGAWLRAIERLLLDDGVVDRGELATRVAEFASGDRDASEFVVGEHAHDHEHGPGHDHGHGHDHQHDHDNGHDHGHNHET